MARHRFGGVADYVISLGTDNAATLQPGASVTCWNLPVGGTQYTDLTQSDGATAIEGGILTADSTGAVPEFYGPDGIRSLYLDANDGSGPRRATAAMDLDADLTAIQNAAIAKSAVTTAGDLLVATGSAAVTRLAVGTVGQVLAPDPVAAGGVRWGAGWRRRDLPDPLLAETLSSEAPTITLTGPQATSSIPSAQSLLAPDTGPFLYLGAGGFQYGSTFPDTTLYLPTSRYPNTYASGQSNWAVEFATDASQFEIMFKYISTATRYRCTIDGRALTDVPQSTGAASAGSRYVLKFAFASAMPRRIRFDFTTMPFGGLFLPPGATAWKSTGRGGRLAVLGDSITDGSGQNTGAGVGTWLYRAARLLGCTDAWDQARGGTGYITPGSYAVLGDRVALDVVPYSIDRLIVWAGYNDSGGDQGAIGAAADSLYAAAKTAVAVGGDIYVIGCWDPTGAPTSTITATNTTIKASAQAARLPFLDPLSGEVYTADGTLVATQGAWITSQNKTGYIGADAVHPTDAGHAYLARRIVEALKALMPA
ncbi:SGNH/GDSL hydrolase family protein [Streptomyces odontomachi]|uniref:SGNH/GDSL hydrolase family protein n=1 Tax=Streptomyces odontomachi TaxID=2944940 RepID=UPI002108E2CB|nr:SGNH/GDSL hydrolase family protein [Streptomyces sp. ODS25]